MDQINNNNEPVVEQEEVMAPTESVMSPEMLAEMEAMKDMDLHGNHVQKIGGCAVVTVGEEVIALEMPFTYPQLLSTIIKRKYDADQSEAITANFLAARTGAVSDEKAAEYTSEYEAYQAYRDLAKTVAKEVMGIEA